MADPENRTHLTSIECTSAVGISLPPMLVLKGQVILRNDIQRTMPGNWLLATSPSGYANEKIMLRWLEWFEELTRKQRVGTYRLLVFDGFEGQTSFEFVRFCELHDIIPYELPAHSTHLLQPMDVGVFQPLKHYHQEAIAQEVRTGADSFTRQDFLHFLPEIRRRGLKKGTIVHAWKKAGCHPIDVDIILEQLPSYDDNFSESELEEEQGSDGDVTRITPRSHQKFKDATQFLHTQCSDPNLPLPPFLKTGLEKYFRVADEHIKRFDLTEKQLDSVLVATSARTKRKHGGAKQVAKGKILSVG